MTKAKQPKKASAKETKKAPAKEVQKQPKKASATSAEVAAEAKSDALTMKEILEREEKVSFYIPLEAGEKAGAFETVTINGYRMEVKKGVMQELPKSVVAILAEHYKVAAEAGKQMLIENDDKKLEALSE